MLLNPTMDNEINFLPAIGAACAVQTGYADAGTLNLNVSSKERPQKETKMIEVIFDNGGGINVQTDTYTHNYDDAAQAATDVKAILDGESTSGWDGNDREMWIDTSSAEADDNFWAQVRNGGYRHYDLDDVKAEIAKAEATDTGWRNIDDFFSALRSQGA
jgi:hypothetical protein